MRSWAQSRNPPFQNSQYSGRDSKGTHVDKAPSATLYSCLTENCVLCLIFLLADANEIQIRVSFFKTTPFSLLNSYRRSAQYGDFIFSVVINIRESVRSWLPWCRGHYVTPKSQYHLPPYTTPRQYHLQPYTHHVSTTCHPTPITSIPLATLHDITFQKTCGYCINLIWPVGARMIVKLDPKLLEVSKYINLTTRCACDVKTPECSLLQKAVRMHSYMLS